MTPARRAGDFAQALMDIGATICRPKAPGCLLCPLSEECRAAASGAPESYPGKAAKKPRPEKVGAVFFAESPNGAFLARRRPPRGLLGGTMELPGGPWRPGDLAEVGAEDAPFLAASDYMAAKIPGAKKVVIPAAGHAVNIDQPQAFIEAVLPFLDHLPHGAIR